MLRSPFVAVFLSLKEGKFGSCTATRVSLNLRGKCDIFISLVWQFVMVVARIGTRVPLRPLSVLETSHTIQKSKVSSIRRNLFGSTPDLQYNLNAAKRIINSSATEFANRWGFDPVCGRPIPHGRFQWKSIAPKVLCPKPVAIKPSIIQLPSVEELPSTAANARLLSNCTSGNSIESETNPNSTKVHPIPLLMSKLRLDHPEKLLSPTAINSYKSLSFNSFSCSSSNSMDDKNNNEIKRIVSACKMRRLRQTKITGN